MEPLWIIVLLMAAEFYVFGFVLGSIGVILLLAAVVVCDVNLGTNWAAGLFFLEVVLGVATGYAATQYGPETRMGRKMVLSRDLGNAQSGSEQPPALIGRQGVAETLLRPAGVATVDGKRLDVVAESGLIERGSSIKIVSVAGAQIVVRKV
jgi:membrane-bound serine protease (ClpP class)